jgi:hypothetical protein
MIFRTTTTLMGTQGACPYKRNEGLFSGTLSACHCD